MYFFKRRQRLLFSKRKHKHPACVRGGCEDGRTFGRGIEAAPEFPPPEWAVLICLAFCSRIGMTQLIINTASVYGLVIVGRFLFYPVLRIVDVLCGILFSESKKVGPISPSWGVCSVILLLGWGLLWLWGVISGFWTRKFLRGVVLLLNVAEVASDLVESCENRAGQIAISFS